MDRVRDLRTAKLSYNPDTRVRIHSIPSLELKAELLPKLFVRWRGMRTVPGRSLLLLVPDATPNQIVVVDTAEAKEIARLDLDAAKTGDVGGWVPFADPEGRYIGVYGSHWIQIFAVRPKE